jgi:hypothetical protein
VPITTIKPPHHHHHNNYSMCATGLLSQEQELMRDEQGLPYETDAAAAAQPTALPATLRDVAVGVQKKFQHSICNK